MYAMGLIFSSPFFLTPFTSFVSLCIIVSFSLVASASLLFSSASNLSSSFIFFCFEFILRQFSCIFFLVLILQKDFFLFFSASLDVSLTLIPLLHFFFIEPSLSIRHALFPSIRPFSEFLLLLMISSSVLGNEKCFSSELLT